MAANLMLTDFELFLIFAVPIAVILIVNKFVEFLYHLGKKTDKDIDNYIFNERIVERAVQNVLNRSTNKLNRDYVKEQMITGFKMYLKLIKRYPHHKVMMPSDAIEELWIQLRHDDDAYRTICHKTLGYYLSYESESAAKVNPHRGVGKLNVEHLDEHCRRTVKMVDNVFGTINVPLFTLDHELGNTQGFDYDIQKMVVPVTGAGSGTVADDGYLYGD